MINIHHLILACVVLVSAGCLRQSDVGTNDWSRQNIGHITEINFAPYTLQTNDNKNIRQFKNLFYYSELGLFGHLNRKTGQVQSRESLGEAERVIQSDDKQLVILTPSGQIVRYNKFTMAKSVDNRVATKEFRNIHSYLKANNKIYIADDKFIRQFESSAKKIEELSLIPVPSNSIFLKVYATTEKQINILHALTYSVQKQQFCINQVKEGGLLEKHCLKVKLGLKKYAKVFPTTGNIYFGDESDHYYLNFISSEWEKFNSRPVSFTHSGVKFENGLSFTIKGVADEKFIAIESNRNDKMVYGESTSSHLHIHLGSQTEIQDKIAVLNLHGRQFGISRVWVNFLTPTDVEVIILFQDLQLVLFSYEGKEFKEVWSREESLAYVEKVLFMKYKGYQDHLNNPYHMKMDDIHYIQLPLASRLQQIPINFLARVKSQLEDVYNFIVEKVEGLIGTFTNPRSFQELLNVKGYLKSSMSPENEKKYGLQKYIIVITSYNTMFSVDSKSGNIIWKKKYGTDVKLVALIKLKQEYEKEIAIVINYKYHIAYVTQIDEDGTVTQLQEFQTFCEPTVHKISVHSILLQADDKVHRFDINKELFGAEKQYSFYSIQEDARKILGWKITNEDLIQTWTFELPSTEKILKTTSSYRGQPEANLPLVNDKKVLFKNVDFSNLAVLTMEDYKKEGSQSGKSFYRLHLYLINGLTGAILFSQYQIGLNPNLPINLVYDEHNAIVSYYNILNRVYQVWSIQSFQAPEESQLISKKYEPQFQKQDIIFMSKVYGTVLPIKHLFISESKQALLKRNLLIITRENKIISIPREMISTRRPKTNEPETNANSPMAEYITSKYPPEEYILPVNTLAYLNYNKDLADVSAIRFSSSDLESTIFILAHGIDMFLIRTAPDKAFDMLADGFNYVQLVAIMIGVTIAAIFFKGKAKQAKLRKAHLE